MTLAEIDEAINGLELAMAKGTLEATFGDRTRRYRSVAEIRNALSYFKNLRLEKTGDKKKRRFSVVRFNA